jgi:hypothetical protein
MTTSDDVSAIVLVCALCGRQRELPAPVDLIGPGRDGWLHCAGDAACKSTKFNVRLRVPTVKTEPHP